jgi:hypothetical protein
MRILLAAKHAPEGRQPMGGVQSWCRTIASEFRQMGYEAITWGPEQPLPEGRFDLGIIANAEYTLPALDRCQSVVNVSHGIIPAEKPLDGVPLLFTSEGVREFWGKDGGIIRQPIDLAFWQPDRRAYRCGFVRYSYRAGLGFLRPLSSQFAQPFNHISWVTPEHARTWMQNGVLVFASGRAALEAAACGAAVVVCDYRRSYQGPLAAMLGEQQMLNNYSGRGGVEANPITVRDLIIQALKTDGSWWRYWVEQHHDARIIANQILETANA